MPELLQELIEFVMDASPTVWGILIKQVYVEAIGSAIGAIVLGAATVILVKFTLLAKAEYDDDGPYSTWEIWMFVIGLCAAIAGIIAVCCAISSVQYLINPEFYAIRFITSQLGGG